MLETLLNPENLQKLDSKILLIIGTLLFLSIFFLVAGIRRFLHGKLMAASLQSLSGISLFLTGLLLLSISINFYSYERLTYEREIAELSFEQLADQRYRVKIVYQTKNKTDEYLINGDEWQIDARVIKWRGWAQLLGLDAQYRLERISGRYSDIDEELNQSRTAYSLNAKDEVDYWKLINQYKKYIPWIDAYYGSAAYLPMSDNAKYALSLTQSGLIARPVNTETEEKIKLW